MKYAEKKGLHFTENKKKIKTIIKKSSENKIFSIFKTVEKLRNKEGRTGKRERAERKREGEQDR